MIPKIIHLCWLSGDPYPKEIQKCLDSWKTILPDYEVILWNKEKFNIYSTMWTKQAYENKKYAFAADYIRLYALYNYGGIYLDSDVLVYKSFNDLLNLPYFVGCDYVGSFEAAVLGFEKNSPVIAEILKYYENRSFVKANGDFDMLPLPKIFLKVLSDNGHDFVKINGLRKYNVGKTLYVFHRDFFNSRNSVEPRKTKKSYCSHCYAGSWVRPGSSFKSKLKRNLPNFIKRIIFFFTNKLHKKRLDAERIKFVKRF